MELPLQQDKKLFRSECQNEEYAKNGDVVGKLFPQFYQGPAHLCFYCFY
jgi:hypothetical protein